MGDLFEREREAAGLTGLAQSVRDGEGGLSVIEGDAGVGKTSLLRLLDDEATRLDVQVLDARGAELEADYAYGVIGQLLEPALGAGLQELLGGGDALEQDASFARLGELYALVNGLADDAPTLLVVDDAQWADAASLRFLTFLGRRVRRRPLGLAVAMRPSVDGVRAPLLEALAAEPDAERLRPRPLTGSGTELMLSERLDGPVDAALAEACADVTGGNPFLLSELTRELVDGRIRAEASALDVLREAGPASIARAVLGRLRAHESGEAATEAARWFAVAGEGVTLDVIAELANTTPDATAAAADDLADSGLMSTDGSGRWQFVHHVVRNAIYQDIPPGERAGRHAEVARLLTARGERSEAVAAHLLASNPAGDPARVGLLRDAASRAGALGAPDAGVAYLRRALAEPPPEEERAEVLRELARAEARAGDPETADRMLEAYSEASELGFRVETAVELAATMMAVDRFGVVGPLLADLADETEGTPHAARVEVALINAARFETTGADVVERRRDRIDRHLGDPETAASVHGHALLAGLAFDGAMRARPAGEVVQLATAALADRLLPWDMSRDVSFGMAVHALMLSDALEEANAQLTWGLERCATRGSAAGMAWLRFFRAFTGLRRGALDQALEDASAAVEIAQMGGQLGWMGAALGFLLEVQMERGEADAAQQTYERLLGSKAAIRLPIVADTVMRAEGLLLLERGDAGGALACFRAVERADASWSVTNSAGWIEWRSLAALAEHRLGNESGAAELARTEVEEARHIGAARGVSVALRAQARVDSSVDRVALLEEAVAITEDSPALLERAHAEADLGVARVRAGRTRDGRATLTGALDRATRCGAAALAARVREELVAAGARPRRDAVLGRDALTPAETRVARLAADGLSNADIARELVVAQKTVEMHLARSYRKLGIGSRTNLAQALQEQG